MYVSQQALLFQIIAVVDVYSLARANSEVRSQRRKHHFLNSVAQLHVFGRKGGLGTFVEMIQPLEVDKFVLAQEELTAGFLVEVMFYFLFRRDEFG